MNNINFGNWQDLDKLQPQTQWVDPHKNAFGSLLRAADPMTYIPGLNVVSNAVHDAGDNLVTQLNTGLSKVTTPLVDAAYASSPLSKPLHNAVPMLNNVDNFVKNKPFDAAALMAATFFSGGAAADAMGSAATAATPAASGGAGAMGGMASSGAAGSAAITPAFESGAVSAGAGAGAAGSTTGSLIDAGAITPALSSGSYGGVAGTSGTGTFGTAGTAAATNALTPSFATMGGASSPGLLGQMQDGYKQFDKYDQYRRNLSKFSTPDNTKNDSYNASRALADQVLNSNDPRQDRIKRIADRISINRWGIRQ